MTNPYLLEIKSEFKLALTQNENPLKFCVLGSIGLDNTPQTRLIGLREITDDFEFMLYTDERSNKVSQIRANPKVSLLFYHPEKKLQLKIDGIASIIKDQDLIKEKWLKISPKAQKDYTTESTPGSKLSTSKEIKFLKDNNFFCIIEVQALNIEYLKLRDSSHFKVQFYKDLNGWVSEFLVP